MNVARERNVLSVAWWIAVGIAVGVWIASTQHAAAEYYAAYLLELSLSVDDIFVSEG